MATTSNCVQLLHVPSGLRVRCHASRSREQNRVAARVELAARLDDLLRGSESARAVAGRDAARRAAAAHRRAAKRHAALAATAAVAAKVGAAEAALR